MPDIPELPFQAFGTELDNVIDATINKLERQWPDKWRSLPGAKVIVESIASTYLL